MDDTGYELQIAEDTEALSLLAARMVAERMGQIAQDKERMSLALSGGSTPRKMFTILAGGEDFREQIPWERVHFFWGDERHVAPGHPESNYRMAYDTMLSKVPVPGENIHRVMAEQADADEAAAAYEEEMRRFFRLGPKEFPRFDCVLLGMGPDGHTASLFPGTAALGEKRRLAMANWVETFQTYRITMTAPVLNNAREILVLVGGEEKAAVLKEVLEGERQPVRLPIQLVRPVNGRLIWLVDRPAARLLRM